VIDGLINYIMQALPLPPGVIEAIDCKRRAFLWAGTSKTSGSKCLVNWETVMKPLQEGGLGVRNLAAHNAALLLKLMHRLFNPEQSAWASWARQNTNLITPTGPGSANHWQGLKALMPVYRSITRVSVGNGKCWGKAASFPLVASEVILHLRNLRRLKRRRISFDGKC